jgi:hypothetical protein
MTLTLNADSFEIKNYELTKEGFLKFWFVGGIPDSELHYADPLAIDGKRREIINADALFNEDSINTAVGKPITLNHPPRAVNASNYRNFALGTILSEYQKDPETGALVMSGIIHDSVLADKVMKGEYKYVSMGYSTPKTLNDDGVLVQTLRDYNHGGVLDAEHMPRAGENSKIVILDETVQKQSDAVLAEDITPASATTVIPATTEDIKTPEIMQMPANMEEFLEILTAWKPVLDEHGKAINYNGDAKAVKRQIMSIFYPEKTMKSVKTENIDGMWIGFLVNNDAQKTAVEGNEYAASTPASRTGIFNYDAEVDTARDAYIKKLESKKK